MTTKFTVREGEYVDVDLVRELDLPSNGKSYTFMWSPADGELRVEANTGKLVSTVPMDYEKQRHHWVMLQVFENDKDYDVQKEIKSVNLTVQVEDTNDSPPSILNPLPLRASAYPVDNLSVGDTVYTLLLNDPDSVGSKRRQWTLTTTTSTNKQTSLDAMEYFEFGVTLSSAAGNGKAGGFFYPNSRDPAKIEKVPIVVRKTPIPPNAEFIFPIRIVDEVGNFVESTISILSAPRPPQFQQTSYKFEIPEATPVNTKIGAIKAVSFSDATIAYSMQVLAGSNSMFKIDSYQGILTLKQTLDFDIAADDPSSREFKLQVTASESKIGGFASSVIVEVMVTDSNDCAPSFDKPVYIVPELSEIAPIGQTILTARATDCDTTWPNNQITIYSTDPRFFFDNATSTLKVASKLDFEDTNQNQFEFTLVARDGGRPPLTGTAHVKIKLVNKADEPPVFVNTDADGGYSERVSESITDETIVAKVDAVDPDGLADKIRFYFEESTFDNPFYINEETGIVKKKSGSALSQSKYKLRIRAVDDVTAARGDEKKEAFAPLTIEINEENNHKPMFKNCDGVRQVSESAQVGSVVFEVEAIDEDSGRYGQVKYGLVALLASSNSEPEFQIRQKRAEDQNQKSKVRMIGEVILLRKVSRDDGDFRTLTINATDTYSPQDDTLLPMNLNVGVCTITVQIIDANDKKPIFASSNYEVDIPSVKKVGEPIIRVVAYDNDLNENGEVFYTLVDPRRSGNFQIDRITGDISVNSRKLADIRIDTKFDLIVTATDRGQPPRSTNTSVVIKVLANSDIKPPRFTISDTNISVSENHPIGTARGKEIGLFQARADNFETVLITLQTGTTLETNSDKTFAIPATADDQSKLYVVKPIDYEKIKSYYLTVKAALASNQNIYTLLHVTIEVGDKNDEVPEFVTPDETFYGSVKEDDSPGTYVATVRAEDKDLGLGGEVSYSIPSSSSSSASYFAIDEVSGIVTLQKSLRTMDPPRSSIHLNVQAKDQAPSSNPGTQGPNVNSVYVAITIIDVNDHPPKFDQDVYYVNVKETTPIGEVLKTVTATDEDNVLDQIITYRIERGNIGGAFEINHDSGVIKLVRPLDYDFGQQSYNLTVLASDGKLSGRAYVQVNVIDENDEAPKFDMDLYVAEAVENSPIGTVIIKVQAVDQDLYLNPPGEVRYRLEGDGANDQFSINEVTGVVKIRKNLDREERPVWNLLVFAEDISPNVVPNSDQLASAELSIEVRDVNDNAPYFILPDKRGTIPENRPAPSLVMTMPAKDADENSVITYELIDGPLDLFEIDPETSEIRTLQELDREGDRGFQFELLVQAKDEDGAIATGVAFIEVSDVNDNPPFCERESYTISVSEGAISGQSVFIFNVEDKDSNAVNGMNKVTISEGNINTVFDVTNPSSGGVVNLLISSLEERGIIDYESDRKTYNLTIDVWDDTFSNIPAKCKIDVTVLDYNDNAPIFDPSTVPAVEVDEDVAVGYVIATVHATDRDEDGQQDIRFEVDWETDVHDWFKVEPDLNNPRVGKVMVKNPLDREMVTIEDRTAVYSFNVLAIDRPSNIEFPRLQGSIGIVVTIRDVNDNAPVWAENYKPEIRENEGPGTWVQILEAIDFDNDNDGNGEPISIEWADPDTVNPDFELEKFPGTNMAKLRNKRPFDREKTPSFLLEFELCDSPSANPQMCAIRPLVVSVLDENEFPPSDGNTYIHAYVWPELGNTVDISTGILNREIGDVMVTDPDCCNRTTQSYEMITTDKQLRQYFSLSKNFVTLSQGTPPGRYFLKVRVTDSLFPSAVAISSIEVYVELLEHDAMDNALALRIKGMSSREFVTKPKINEKSTKDKFSEEAAKLLKTQARYVEIFSVNDVPVSNLPVYPQIFEPPTIDIVFAAHGSPYYQQSKMYGIMAENKQEVAREIQFEDGVVELVLEDIPLNLCGPGVCSDQIDESCATMLTFANKPVPVLGQSNAFVGIDVGVEPQCGVCEALQMITLPDGFRPEAHPDPCFADPCQNGGQCKPVVTKVVANQAYYSYRCTCSPAYSGPNCELDTLTFNGDGFSWFDSIPLCAETTISLQFSTIEEDGLLFYNGPITDDTSKPDFIALVLFGGALKLISDFGNGVQVAQLSKDPSHPLNDGNWHTVDIMIEKDLIKMEVDMCKNSFIKEESSTSSQDYYTCFLVQYLKGRSLDLNAPLQVGGVSDPDVLESSVIDTGFDGCVREFLINGKIVDFSDPAKTENTRESCEDQEEFCIDETGRPRCGQHGKCVASMFKFLYCDCHPRYEGTTCLIKSPEYTFGPSDSLIRYSVDPKGPAASTLLNARNTEITLSFRSTAKDVSEMILLGFHDSNDAGFIRIYIAKSILSLKHNLGGRGEEILQLESRNVTDGQWHSVRVMRDGKRFKMFLDGGGERGTMVYSSEGTLRLLQIDPESIMIGGYISETSGEYDVTSNFQGCISDVRFNRIQLPLGYSSTLAGVSVANRTGITEGCNPDPCGSPGVTCPGSLICVPVFDQAHCACPVGTRLNDFDQCVDILECDLYKPCVHAIECRDVFGSYECECENDWSGRNCDEAGPAALVATATLSLAAIIVILCAIIFLLLILMLFCYCRAGKKAKAFTADDLDFHDQNMGKKVVEGGGEDDADFVLDQLRKPVNHVPSLTPPPFHASHTIIPNGKSPSVNHSTTNLSGGPKVNPRYIASSPVPHRGTPTPGHNEDVGRYLKAKTHELDRHAANMGGHDTLMVYHYEGGDSDRGDVSDVMSQASEPNYEPFHKMGPPFHKMANMFAPNGQTSPPPPARNNPNTPSHAV
ncbi:neural-cadherin-like isoform X3 [Symsagittifera roscoffensis]|uniref:neural-cadherin-like isoform X3 n=1 Tax=Symsagittifera roscoffensis TaxID=84072 RepID=UPI00307C1BDA